MVGLLDLQHSQQPRGSTQYHLTTPHLHSYQYVAKAHPVKPRTQECPLLSCQLLYIYASYTGDVGAIFGSGDGSNVTVLREAADNLEFYLGMYGGLAAANSVSTH